MRTKTLLITAALSLAGAASSMAQVYSVNAVGYINLTLRPGFNMVANQLNRTPNNLLNNVVTGIPGDSQVLKFSNSDYQIEFFDGATWVKQDFITPGTLTINPGEGLFLFNPDTANVTITLVGEVPQGNVNVELKAGFSLVASKVPQAIALTLANGFPQVSDAQYLTFNAATQNYDDPIFNDGVKWVLQDFVTPAPTPTPAVGQGFFYFNPDTASSTWTRNFTVN